LIELKDITRIYSLNSQPVHALKNINLKIHKGEFVAIMGTSGSGKSTMMNILGCLDRPTSGVYLLNEIEVQHFDEDELASVRNRQIGFVFQQFNLLSRMSAFDNVMLPLVYAGVPHEARIEKAESYLRLVGLGDRMRHLPTQLSGGEQQRVSIARALVNDPTIVLADEPTGALDSHTSAEIMTLICELHDRGITIILVTHDPEVASYARRVVRLKDGEILSDEKNSSRL